MSVVNCHRCQRSFELKDAKPSFSVYSDIRCPFCGSTDNAHNSEYARVLFQNMRVADITPRPPLSAAETDAAWDQIRRFLLHR